MRTQALAVLMLVASGSLALADPITDALTLRTIGDVQATRDGGHVAYVVERTDLASNKVETTVWILTRAGDARPADPIEVGAGEQPRWSPDGSRLAFLAPGAGHRAVWTVAADGKGAAVAVGAGSDIEHYAWLPDGSGILFTMRDPLPAASDIDVRSVGASARAAALYRQRFDATPERLTPGPDHIGDFDVARGPDGRTRVAYITQPSSSVRDARLFSDLHLLDLDTRDVRTLVARPGLETSPRFSPDGALVAFVSMNGVADWLGNYFVCTVRIDGSDLRNATARFDERIGYHTAEREASFRWAADGRSVLFLGHEGPALRLWRADVATGNVTAVSGWDANRVVASFAVSAAGTFVVASDPGTPEALHRLDPPSGAQPLVRVNANYPLASVPVTERLSYKAADGMSIEALVVRPSPVRTGRTPLLVVVHGGPMGLFDLGFAPRQGAYPIHAFAAAGYTVLMPNPRGSGGYGERFRKAVVGQWGMADYEDILAGIDVLVGQGRVDPGRVGLLGWSYGGYMAAWTLTQSSRFKAISIGAAITDLASFWGTTDIPEFAEAYHGGRPWDAPEAYRRHSPMTHVTAAKTPALIQHGAADVRVPLGQGLAFHRALERQRVPVEMSVYPREGHLLQEPRHVRHALDANLAWFIRWIPPE